MRAMSWVDDVFFGDVPRSFDVTRWPRWLRRTFILSLPISGPAYIVAWFAFIVAAIVAFIVAVIVDGWR